MESFLIQELTFLVETLLNQDALIEKKATLLGLVNTKIEEIETEDIYYALNLYTPENASKFSTEELRTLDVLSSYTQTLIKLAVSLNKEATESYNQFLYQKEGLAKLLRDSENKINVLEAYRDQVRNLIRLLNSRNDWKNGSLNIDDSFNGITLPISNVEKARIDSINAISINGSVFGFPLDRNNYIDSSKVSFLLDGNQDTFFSFSKVGSDICSGQVNIKLKSYEIINAIQIEKVIDGFNNEVVIKEISYLNKDGTNERIDLNQKIESKKVIVINPIETNEIKLMFQSKGNKEIENRVGLSLIQSSISLKEVALLRLSFKSSGILDSRSLEVENCSIFLKSIETEKTSSEAFEVKCLALHEKQEELSGLEDSNNDFVKIKDGPVSVRLSLKRSDNIKSLENLTGETVTKDFTYEVFEPSNINPETLFVSSGIVKEKVGVCQSTLVEYRGERIRNFSQVFTVGDYSYFEIDQYDYETLDNSIEVYNGNQLLQRGINSLPLPGEYCLIPGNLVYIVVLTDELFREESLSYCFPLRNGLCAFVNGKLQIQFNEPIVPEKERVEVYNKQNPIFYTERITPRSNQISLDRKNLIPRTLELTETSSGNPIELEELEFNSSSELEPGKIYVDYANGILYISESIGTDILVKVQYRPSIKIENFTLATSNRNLVEGIELPLESIQIGYSRERVTSGTQGVVKLKYEGVIKSSVRLEQDDSDLKITEVSYKDGWSEFRGSSEVKIPIERIRLINPNIWEGSYSFTGSLESGSLIYPDNGNLTRQKAFAVAGISLLGEKEYMIDSVNRKIYFYSEDEISFNIVTSITRNASEVQYSIDYRNGILFLEREIDSNCFIEYQYANINVAYESAIEVLPSRVINEVIEIPRGSIKQDREIFVIKTNSKTSKVENLESYYSPVIKALVIGKI